MGIGYKTAWLAFRDATPEDVSDALGLHHRQVMDWTSGTETAYRSGVFVARPVPDRTLAHGRIHLTCVLDPTDPRFPARLESLSAVLGDLQFFLTDRIGEDHAWARTEGGVLTRAYCYSGTQGHVPLHHGEPTDIERELGVGQRILDDGWEEWDEGEWDAWFAAMPGEQHVMEIARRWGLCPLDIRDDAVAADGIHGFPLGVEVPAGSSMRSS